MHEVKQALPDNFLIFSESITNQAHLSAAVEPTEPGRMIKVRGGGIGPGLPGSLGAQLARPDRNMVEYLGKGARGRRVVEMDLTDPDLRFDRMAESMSVPGRRVERPEDLAPALREAIAHDGPSLVDVALESPVPIP